MPFGSAVPWRLSRWPVITAVLAGIALVVLGGIVRSQPAQAVAPPIRYTVSVTPDHGAAGSTFIASLTISPGTCDSLPVTFYLGRDINPAAQISSPVSMPDSCTATTTVTVAKEWPAGDQRIYATYGEASVPHGERAAAFSVVVPVSTATATASATVGSQPSPTAGSTTPTPSGAVTMTPSDGTSSTLANAAESDLGDSPASDGSQLVGDRSDGGGGVPQLVWLTIGLTLVAAGLAVMAVRRRRLAAAEPEGKHRRGPGRWNASDYP